MNPVGKIRRTMEELMLCKIWWAYIRRRRRRAAARRLLSGDGGHNAHSRPDEQKGHERAIANERTNERAGRFT